MFKILRKLFGKKELEPDQDIQEILDQQKQDREKHDRYMENRYLIKDAAVKGDIEAVKEMIKIETHPVQKHELYHLAFHAAYEEKDRPSALIISEQIGTLYFKFFENNPTVVGESRYNLIYLNMVKLYVLTKEFNKAIDACRKAIELDLSDGTKTGFKGRLKRIENQKAKSAS
ncbi:MAG: hypothetical protein HOC09_03400 [Deltaproteobacteria bacterium]|jgi:hypothetical protein|nr:hypothetical protein [Deltaproteobacteria bacterium]